MGLKLQPSTNAIPVSIDHGKVSFKIGSSNYGFDVPALKDYVFEEQCTMYINKYILAYVSNDKVKAVLRYDGTGCLFTKKEDILIKHFIYEPVLPIVEDEFYHGCIVTIEGVSFNNNVNTLHKVGPDYILSSGHKLSATFRGEDEMVFLKDVEGFHTDVLPMMRVLRGRLEAFDSKSRLPRYTLQCDVNYSEGVCLL